MTGTLSGLEAVASEERLVGQAARLQGVVTWEVPGYQNAILVHTGETSVLVATTNMDVRPRTGDLVEVEGQIAPGQFKEMVREARIRVIGSRPLPEPVPRTARQLALGIHFGEWIRLECLVHDWGRARGDLVLQVTSQTQPFYAYVTVPPGFEVPADLVDSVIELSGVVWTLAGPDQRPYGFRLHVPGTNCLRTLRRGPADFLNRPTMSSQQLRLLKESQDDHVEVRGTITHVYQADGPYRIVLEDDAGPIAAYLHVPIGRDRNVAPYWRDDPGGTWNARPAPPAVRAGDVVEVVGSPSAEGEAVPLLHGAELRVLQHGKGVAPREIRATEALSPGMDHALVRLKARVLDRHEGEIGQQPRVTFWLQSDGMVFEARLMDQDLPSRALPKTGLTELTGLALPMFGQAGRPRGLQLELRSAADIQILKEPSPLLSAVVLRWFGISTGALLLALLWVWMLRRQVARRTGELATSVANKERAETELIQALERERDLGKLKSNLVSMVSHEFRTPLGVIVSSAEILRRYLDRLSPEKRQEQLDVIQRATQNLSNLVEDVLLLGKVEAGKLQYQPEPLDVMKLCRHLIDEVLSATNRRCPIQFRHNGLLKDAVGDETLLRPILANLLSNAVKYSQPDAPVQFEVTRVTRANDPVPGTPISGGTKAAEAATMGLVQFTIRDRGVGIPREDQRRLFKAFTRGSNVGERPGTGLGLVIVKRCVELHGGIIWLESAPGEGTLVTIRLPMIKNV